MKRLFALLLVTCLVVSMLPMHTLAEQNAVVTSAGAHDNAAHVCEHCKATTTWTAWGEGKTTLPTAEGHYYLTKDISVTAATISSGHVVLCLNGYTVTANGTSGNAADRFYNVKNGGSLTITDCTASGEGNTYTAGKFTGASNVGFNADSTATGTITIYDGIFEKNVGSVNGGVINVNGSADLYVYGGRFAENKATGKGGGVILANKGANFVHLENAVFDQNQAGWGGAVYHTGSKSDSAPLTMEVINCTFTGNSTTSSTGAALCYSANAVVTIEGSTFANNIANTAGGAIRITGTTSNLTIKNSSFTGNTGKAGAGAIWAGGNVTLDGVTMKNNVSNGTDIIAGKGAITLGDKDASTKAAQTLTVKGNTQIVDNGANVVMTNGTDKIVVTDLASTAVISVAGVAGDELTGAMENAASVKGNFKADDATLKVGVKDDKLVLEAIPNHTDAAHQCEHCKTTTTWTAWGEGKTTLPTADGHYYLTKDLNVTAADITSGHVVLCLNGKTITANGTEGNPADRIYQMKNAGSLTITDCTAHTEDGKYVAGTITGGTASAIMFNKDNAEGIVNIYDAIFTGNYRASSGGAICVQGKGKLNIYGGEFTGNSTDASGGVIYTSGSNNPVYIENAVFKNNTAVSSAGVLYNLKATVTLKNVTMTGNSAPSAGVIVSTGPVTYENTTITGNRTTSGAYGALHHYNSSSTATVILKGATVINGNTYGDENSTVERNLYLRNHSYRVSVNNSEGVAYLTAGANIGLSFETGKLTGNNRYITTKLVGTGDPLQYLHCDDAAYEVQLIDGGETDGNRLVFAEKVVTPPEPDHAHKLCKDAACADHTDVVFQKWEKTDSLPSDGAWYLTEDVQMSSAVEIKKNLTLCLNGHTVTAKSGVRHFAVTNGVTVTITDCADAPGGFTGGSNKFGGSVNINAGGTLNLYAGSFKNNISLPDDSSNGYGGAIYLQATKTVDGVKLPGGVFNMYGGELSGNQANRGAAVYGAEGTTFYAENAKITGNTASQGALYMQKCTTTLKNTVVSGNTGTNGSAACIFGGTAVLDGAKIENNHATSGYGALHLNRSGDVSLTVQGATVIANNTTGDSNKIQNIYMRQSTSALYLTVGALTDGANVGITMENSRLNANNLKISNNDVTAEQAAFLHSDNNAYFVDIVDGKATLAEVVVVPDHAHKLCKDAACATHADVEFKKWEKTDSLPSDGAWYLTEDVQMSSAVEIKKDLTLCLNGHTVTAKSGVRHFAVTNGVTVTITDCADAPGGFTGGSNKFGGSVNINAGGTLNLYAGSFTGNVSVPDNADNGQGGAIYLQGTKKVDGVQIPGGVFNMYGGELSGNQANRGAAVYGAEGTTFYAENAKITGNTANQGALYMAKANMTLKNTEVSGNTGTNGSAACIFGGTAVLDGAKIENNHATSGYGAVHLNRSGDVSLTVQGATVIANNTTGDSNKIQNIYMRQSTSALYLTIGALTDGANVGITMENDRLNANNLRISDNDVTADQLAYIVYDSGEYVAAVKDGKAYFTTGHLHGVCGSACADHSELEWRKWTNPEKLPTTSGNYYLDCDVQLTAAVDSPKNLNLCLNGHTVTAKEGARHLVVGEGDTVTITDCTDVPGGFTGGSNRFGGSVNVNAGGTLNLYAGSFTGNVSVPDNADNGQGGAIYLQGSKTVDDVQIPGGVFNMYGGEISGNQANRGAAVYGAAGSTFYAENAKITGNTASQGALYMLKSATTLKNTEVSGNTGTNGSAACIFGGSAVLDGAKIENNHATSGYGAVHLNRSGDVSLTIQGATVIANNTTGEKNTISNLYMRQSTSALYLTIGALTDGANVGITMENDRLNANNLRVSANDVTAEQIAYLSCDTGDYMVVVRDGKAYFTTGHVHGVCGDVCADHADLEWRAWTNPTKLPTTSGNYYLACDVTLATALDAPKNLNLCLNGHTVTAQKDGRAIAVSNGDTLTITDCSQAAGSIVGGNRTFGGAISVQSGAVLNLYAGNITGNTSPNSEGGAIYVQAGKFVDEVAVAGGIVNMYGGKLSGNTANLGAAIRLAGGAEGTEPATFNMYGGEISGNTSVNGAVYATTGSILNLQGGAIINNTATGTVGGVYVGSKETVFLGGDIQIVGNTAKDKPSNLNLPGEVKVLAAGLTENAKISVTAEKFDRFITWETEADYSKNFVSDSAYRVISYKGNAVYLANSTEHQHTVCVGTRVNACEHENIVWVAWESSTTLPITDGYYYLTQDVVMTNQIWVSNKNISLCLNGHTVTAAEGKRLISVQIGTEFTLSDCTGNGKMTGGSSTYGGGINVNAGGVLNMYGGNLTGNASTDAKLGQGGAIYLQAGKTADGKKIDGGIFNMYGGKLTGNTASWGGAIFAKQKAQINVFDGIIADNTAINYGGAIYASEGITTNLGKATISGNFATTGGGAVYVTGANSVLNINGTTFTNNSIDGYGGGAVFAQSTGTVITVNGATFTGNKAKAGGGLYAGGNTTLTVDNSVFTGNTAVQGAAIYEQRATVTIGKVTMTGNTAKDKAAGIYIKAGSVVLDGVTIKNNTGSGSGTAITTGSDTVKIDGVSTIVYPTVEFKSGTISGHKGNSGGAILLQSKTQFTMSGGTITGNTASYGGAIYVSTNASFTMTGGTISGNSVKTNGGAIYALRSTVEIKGGTIANNTAVKMGAGLFASGAKVTMTAGSITGNKTDTGTGGGAIATGAATVSGQKLGTTIQISGGSITNNYGRHGGAILVQGNSDTKVTMTGGRISGNECKVDGGAVYVSTYTTFNQYGGTISNNNSAGRAGAIYHNNSKGNYKNVEFANNSAKSTAGTILINGATSVINMENVKIHDSVSGASAGGLCHQGKGMLIMKDCEIYNCVSAEKSDGGGIYVSNNTPAEIYNTKIYNCYSGDAGGIWVGLNSKVLLDGMTIENNQAKDHGGGVMTRSYLLTIKNSLIEGNKCGQFGAGISSYRFPYQGVTYAPASSRVGTTVENTVIRNNVADGLGGGAYTMMGTKFNLTNVTFTGNAAGAEGGALWSQAELTVDGLTATNNVSSGLGYAVYLETAQYDGHSYTNGYNKFGGDVIVKDNTNGDMFLDETTTIAVLEKGFGEKTHIEITLASGVLTQKVFGAYNYEGGNLVYTLTYGDRSLTDPEFDASLVVVDEQTESAEETAQKDAASAGDIWLYVGIGAVALVVLAVVLLVLKKKKPAAATKE